MKPWRLALGALGLALLAAGLWLRTRGAPAPSAPSAPADLERLDPLLRARLEEELQAVGARRGSAEAWLGLGMLEEANGLFGDAAVCYARALALAPEDAKTLHRLACAQERLGDLDLAAATMARAAQADPSVVASWWRLASWRLDLGQLDAAAEALARVRELLPAEPTLRLGEARLALARGDAAAARRLLEDGGLLAGELAPQAQHLYARVLRQQGDLDGAERAAARASARVPTLPDPWALELQALETGLAALRLRAGRDVQARRFAEAEARLRAVLEHEPDDARSLNMLGVCRLEQGDAAQARELLERALALDPASPEAALNQARALLALRTADADALASAAGRVRLALAARGDDGGAWRLLAALAKARGRQEEALEALERAAELAPEETDVRLGAAYALIELGRFDEALARFGALQAAHPALVEAWYGEVLALLRAGRRAEAGAALERLERRADADPRRVASLRSGLR